MTRNMILTVVGILALTLGGCGFTPVSGRGFNQGMAHHLGPVHERLATQDRKLEEQNQKIEELRGKAAITASNVETMHGDMAIMAAHVEKARDLAISTSAKVGAIQTQLLPSIYSTAKTAMTEAKAARAEAEAAKKAVGTAETNLGKKVDDSATTTQRVITDAESRTAQQVTDSEGRVTKAVMDSEGRVTKVIDPDIPEIRRRLEALAVEHTAKHP